MTYSEAIYQFWASFHDDGAPMDAYLTGNVPDDAVFPCVSFENIQCASFGRTVSTAFVWIRQAPGVNVTRKRDAFFDQVRAAIPENGRIIRYDGGMAVLYRNQSDFLRAYDPPENEGSVTGAPIRGGRVSYEIVFYGD